MEEGTRIEMPTAPRSPKRSKSVFTLGRAVGTLILGVVCILCDDILRQPAIVSNYYYRAALDNGTHCLVAVMSWAVVIGAVPPRTCQELFAVLLCGAVGSLLDLDHFLAARSIYLRDALVLSHRPPLHSSTLILLIFIFLLFAVRLRASKRLHSLPSIFLMASVSHHIRDASRRGLWFWPFGSTAPLPYWLYIALICLIPNVILLIRERLLPLRDSPASKPRDTLEQSYS